MRVAILILKYTHMQVVDYNALLCGKIEVKILHPDISDGEAWTVFEIMSHAAPPLGVASAKHTDCRIGTRNGKTQCGKSKLRVGLCLIPSMIGLSFDY